MSDTSFEGGLPNGGSQAGASRSPGGGAQPVVAQPVLLAHYHEVGLKGQNRRYFENLLVENIKRRLAALPSAAAAGGFSVRRTAGRIQIIAPSAEAAELAAPAIADLPGVVRVSLAFRLPQDLDAIQPVALGLMQASEPFESFKVDARRANTDYPIDSMQLNRLVGGWLHERLPGKQVQMRSPDVTLRLEMVQGAAFLYTKTLPGVGGLPVGSAGKVVALMSAGIDSPVAAWRMMRRGAEVIALHFSGRPETPDTSEHLAAQIASQLKAYGGLAKLAVVPFGDYQRQICELVPAPLRVIFYRRLMFSVAEALAEGEGAKALVTGESLGQVASQTLDNIRAVDQVVALPVLRPLIGTDKLEIIAEAERIGTFAISSQAHDDCCSLFMPKNPETHANLERVTAIWSELPVEGWLAAIAAEMEFASF